MTPFPKPTCPPAAANCCSCAAVRMVVARLGAGRLPHLEGGGREGRVFLQLSPNIYPSLSNKLRELNEAAVSLPPSPVFLASEPPALGQTRPPAVTVYSVHRALFTVCVQCSSGSCRGCSNRPPNNRGWITLGIKGTFTVCTVQCTV